MASQKPSILLLGTQMEMAGAQRVLFFLAEYLYAQGFAVQVAFFYDKQSLAAKWQSEHPFPVVSLGGWRPGGFIFANLLRFVAGLWRLLAVLRGKGAIVTYTPHSNLLGLPIAWLAGVKVRLGTHHSGLEGSSPLLDRVHGWLTNSWLCTRMVCVSNAVRSGALRHEGAQAHKLVVIENGIVPVVAQPLSAAERARLRASVGAGEQQTLCLTVGRLTVQKGHSYLLDAIAQTTQPELVFAFVGHGPLDAELRAKAQHLGIASRVHFVGVRSDVAQWLSVADVFVQPSLWEGMSLALLEAMFAGLPIVATRIPATAEVLAHENTGLLVDPEQPQAMAQALDRIAADAALRQRLGQQAQRVAQQQYTAAAMGTAYQQFIEKLWHG
ncbi:MAG: glycosyltransferase [Anaerolineales bacterium]|jgi:glycosyltransferase involved in cell wall biosynthesis|nr:glycosyltransferase [Anaerolineales bacterium]